MEQALRSGACSAVIGWAAFRDRQGLRRLQLASEQSRCMAVLFRSLAAGSAAVSRGVAHRARGRPRRPRGAHREEPRRAAGDRAPRLARRSGASRRALTCRCPGDAGPRPESFHLPRSSATGRGCGPHLRPGVGRASRPAPSRRAANSGSRSTCRTTCSSRCAGVTRLQSPSPASRPVRPPWSWTWRTTARWSAPATARRLRPASCAAWRSTPRWRCCRALRVLARDSLRASARCSRPSPRARADFTPRVALEPPDGVLLEVRGSLRLFGGVRRLVARRARAPAIRGRRATARARADAAGCALVRARGRGGCVAQPGRALRAASRRCRSRARAGRRRASSRSPRWACAPSAIA